MRGYFESDFFGGHFGPQFGMGGPHTCPFPGEFPGHRGSRPGFGPGPFGHRFDHSPERQEHHQHGPEHHRRGPPEDGHRGPRCCHHESESDSDGPAERHCHGPPGFMGRGGRHPNFRGHGPSRHGPRPCFRRSPERHCFGRRGPSEFPDHPWRGPWEGQWGAGWSRHMHGFGRGGASHPWFGQRRPCPYNSEERPSKNADCEKCRETKPCCSGDKEKRGCGRGRKENGPCSDKDKDQNLGDTVFVQRIVLEKATRPQSV